MDTTIRNLDDHTYRQMKARAAASGRTMGDVVSEAMRMYLSRESPLTKRGSLRDWQPVDFGAGNERLSEDLDSVIYEL